MATQFVMEEPEDNFDALFEQQLWEDEEIQFHCEILKDDLDWNCDSDDLWLDCHVFDEDNERVL